jgi:PilZ domain
MMRWRAVTDDRERFAAGLVPGSTIALVRADGPLVDATVEGVLGVDVDLRVSAGTLDAGSLASLRAHDAEGAWFATFVIIDVERQPDGDAVTARVGDVLCVASERWAERVEAAMPALLRPENAPGGVVRAETRDVSLTGVALATRERPPAPGAVVGVVLAGDGRGSIAFRGRVRRVRPRDPSQLVAVEILGISRDDFRRLERLVERLDREDAPQPE